MYVGKSMEWVLAGETEVLGEIMSQYNYVHHKYHTAWSGIQRRPPRWEAVE
jgi:hypothetical protein